MIIGPFKRLQKTSIEWDLSGRPRKPAAGGHGGEWGGAYYGVFYSMGGSRSLQPPWRSGVKLQKFCSVRAPQQFLRRSPHGQPRMRERVSAELKTNKIQGFSIFDFNSCKLRIVSFSVKLETGV